MTVPAITEPFIVWLWIALTTTVCGFAGVLQLVVLGTVESAVESPAAMALVTAALAERQESGLNYIDRIEWAKVGDRPSLRVYPAAAARHASLHLIDADEAWAQVLKLVPEADSPGMREQFTCHWRFAELGKPGKVSWNLEPWRPLVGDIAMIASRCNPGGNEESY